MTLLDPTANLQVEPEAETYRLDQLVARVRAGQVRVPHFQRGLRWGQADVVALFDSIVRGFPIGSLLLWERPAAEAEVTLGRVHVAAPATDRALWVVDGQQRVTALVNALDATAGEFAPFSLVYDLDTRSVRAARAAERGAIPLPVIFDLPSVLRWAGANPEAADRIGEINAITTRIRDFRIPAYVVRSADEYVLREIFDRMNNAGKRLTRAETFAALTAPEESASGESDFNTLRDHIENDLRWGVVDNDTILRLILARRGRDVTREIRLERFDEDDPARNEFAGESRADAYQGALRAIDAAVNFLREEAGVPHFAFLPYRYLLVVLVRYFAHFSDSHPRNRELLVRWFWRAALIGPNITPGNITGAMRYLGQQIVPGDEDGSVQRLLDHIAGKSWLTEADPARFRANTAGTRVVLCAMWHLGPRSPETGERFTAEDLADDLASASSANHAAQELVGRSSLPERLRGSAGNRVLLPGVPFEAFDALLSTAARTDPDVQDRVLASHLLPAGRAGITVDDLVADREGRIAEALGDFLVLKTGEGLPDTPPLASLDLDDEDRDDLGYLDMREA